MSMSIKELHVECLLRWNRAVDSLRRIHESIDYCNELHKDYKSAAEEFEAATQSLWRFKNGYQSALYSHRLNKESQP